jgi:peptidyl-dipeptidase Dcp
MRSKKRLTWLKYQDFARSGARLDAGAKAKLSDINQRLATLYTEFSQNVLADENTALILDQESDLTGLPHSLRDAAAEAAKGRGQPGKWAILNTRSSVEPFLTYSERRDLRRKVWEAFVSRGDNGNERDNKQIIAEIVKLRGERAQLLGYKSHAHWRLEMSMAKTPERATQLMEAVWKPAVKRVAEEVSDMQAVADKEGAGIRIEPWDYRYYAEKVRKAKYDVDDNEVMPYLQLENLREAMFWVAGELLDLHFAPVKDVPGVPPRRSRVGREGRRPASTSRFSTSIRTRARQVVGRVDERVPQPGAFRRRRDHDRLQQLQFREGQARRADPRVLGRRGHALPRVRPRAARHLVQRALPVAFRHERGSRLRGIPVAAPGALARDAGGPEQVRAPLQDGRAHPPVAGEEDRTCIQVQQGLRERGIPFQRAGGHAHAPGAGQGFRHHEFERGTLTSLGMPKEMVMRHRLPHFGHLFSGDSYSAGYYSYLWADTLSADAFEAFTEAGGAYDKNVAKKLREYVFSTGNSVDPAESYRAFRGRDAGIEALMRRRGFAPPLHRQQ